MMEYADETLDILNARVRLGNLPSFLPWAVLFDRLAPMGRLRWYLSWRLRRKCAHYHRLVEGEAVMAAARQGWERAVPGPQMEPDIIYENPDE